LSKAQADLTKAQADLAKAQADLSKAQADLTAAKEAASAPPPEPTADADADAAEPGADAAEPGADAAEPGAGAPAPATDEITDLRDPALLPADTPAANKKAFSKLPLSKTDGRPVAGAGATGIYLDRFAIAQDPKDQCASPQSSFSPDDERVYVCLRAIHGRDAETLRVVWSHEGKAQKRGNVSVKDIHAFATNAWMPLKNAREGKWSVRLEAEDGAVLGSGDFTISR
ncbi:MAG: DUF2914 domain-containing protein, partial [Myxococcales bacterium]|nr:DUF2914 domain-containing protein [Myxococcales bacterium]